MDKELAKILEHIASDGIEKRNMKKAFLENLEFDGLYHTAKALLRSQTIGIATGFYIKEVEAPESDGPLGAVALAERLTQMGKEVVLITDQHTGPLLKALLARENLKIPVLAMPIQHTEKAWEALFKTYRFDHLMAIERPGKNKDGQLLSSSGVNFTEDAPDFDLAFSPPFNQKYTTSAIGDGGNEIGMGCLADFLDPQISAKSKTNHLIVSGSSNVGAHALCLLLSLMTKSTVDLTAYLKSEEERLRLISDLGAVDGLLKKVAMSVDGVPLTHYLKTLSLLIVQTPERYDLKLSRYKTLIFDADETLFDFPKSEEEALKNALEYHGILYDPMRHHKAYSAINAQIWSEFEKGLITQEALKLERFERFIKHTELLGTLCPKDLANSYLKFLGEACYLYPESDILIETLSKSHKLLILTNGLTVVQQNRIGRSPIAKYFDHIIISEAIGMAKPSPDIFEYALKCAGETDPSKVLMIGDSLTSDIAGGNRAGIDTCWYNPLYKANHTQIRPVYTIHTLKQLRKSI